MVKFHEFEIIWNWSDKKDCIGPIRFGVHAESIIQEYKLKRTSEYEASGQELYEFADGSSISVENGLINGVDCKSNFFYRNINLIGMSLEDIRDLFGPEDCLDEFETLMCLDFDKYNLVVWLKKKTKKVENIFVYQ
jgi:hypothetical protein